MQPEEAFGIVVRTLGLIMTVYGCWCGMYGVGALAFKEGNGTPPKHPAKDYLSTAVMFTFAGVMMLRGASVIVDFAYK